ncbi:outer membrane protein [Labrys wisconsinensis]|uniref:Outer membrane immunogenic protein n=1 Tax=Labrys wisconsinensis TaxID=425677 RepID=A0ABU0JBS1_9HYPH|nr:outer membrane protein [Labrys wisconsinensis]MDQ0471728.1 outer membrane immunogenic protein [Labrys wisconsinensis]
MKKLLLATAAVLGLAGPAMAADLAPNYSEPAAPAPYIAPAGFNWTGFYAGINAGYGFSGDFGSATGRRLNDAKGFVGGGQVGFNYQIDPVVVGIEGELDYSDQKDSFAGSRANLNWRGSLTPRLGFTMDRFLPYVKAGLAFGETDLKVAGVGSDSNTLVGWTAGAGIEYAVTDNISVRGEYNYTDLSKDTFNIGGAAVKTGFRGSDVKAGLNYKF